MHPPKQDQHKVPKVYLKKFGYLDANKQWKVSVIKSGEHFTRQKSIRSFTALTNVFDIKSLNPIIHRTFETFNSKLESNYNAIIDDLENNGKLSEENDAYLMQFTANMICRSDCWRNWALGMLSHENKPNILKAILWEELKDRISFAEFDRDPFFRLLVDSKPEEVINVVLILFTGHLLRRLQHYEMVFLQSPEGKPWFSSTNPVVVENRINKFEIFEKESEIYFPLTPKYLVYMHCKLSEDRENELRKHSSNQVVKASDEQNERLQKIIIDNAVDDYLILAGHFEIPRDNLNSERQ